MSVFSDTFVGVDGTKLNVHIPDVGTGWGAPFRSPTATLSITHELTGAGDCTVSSNTQHTTELADDVPATNEYDVSADSDKQSTLDGLRGILGRATDQSNLYVDCYTGVYSEFGGAVWVLNKYISGVETQLDSFIETWVSGSKSLKLELRDAAKKFYTDGVEIMSTADNVITATGKGGLWSLFRVDLWDWDNFLIEDLVIAPPGRSQPWGFGKWFF